MTIRKQFPHFLGLYKVKDYKENLLPVYVPREQNVIQNILKDNFQEFEDRYDDLYAKQYGKYRIIRIKEAVEKFLECGDYSKGIARIKCTSPRCGHEFFRPFVASLKYACKSWYLCPSCNQKRLLLFSEHLSENVLLKLPHRQFVFALPKLLRVYFKHDRNLFADISKIIFSIINDYYTETVQTAVVKTGILVSYQSYGDLMRWNPHYHCLVLEGGIDEAGSFHHIPNVDKPHSRLSGFKVLLKIP